MNSGHVSVVSLTSDTGFYGHRWCKGNPLSTVLAPRDWVGGANLWWGHEAGKSSD